MGFILFIVSLVLATVLFPLGMIYTAIRLMIGRRLSFWLHHMNKIYKVTAIAIDQAGNAALQHLFNDTLIKSKYKNLNGVYMNNEALFGDEDETISSVIGKNKVQGTLTCTGKVLDKILNFLDPNHSIKSIE